MVAIETMTARPAAKRRYRETPKRPIQSAACPRQSHIPPTALRASGAGPSASTGMRGGCACTATLRVVGVSRNVHRKQMLKVSVSGLPGQYRRRRRSGHASGACQCDGTSRSHQLPNTECDKTAKRVAFRFGSKGSASSRTSPQFASCSHQSAIMAGVTSRWNCRPYVFCPSRNA